ncbi:hypothetical protein D7X25_13265 [bacterium 1XD42-8]|jgi:hypothetical protein|nr:hypothetical protein [Lachnospiraceae bacterium]RKJ53051.1 hypothetical protein D7X25_13265 [bacterium 1XD42-8]
MKKKFLSVRIAGVLGIWVLTGCQKAPEASADSDVYHAKSSLEGEVENIVAKESDTNTTGTDKARSGGSYDALVGTEENGIWICAEVPVVPQTVQTLTLQKWDDWDTEKLRKVLDSESKNVQDITAEYLSQREKELSEMAEEDKPGEWLNFGDDSLMILSDGQKEASFARNTSVSYVDEILKKNCDAIYKKVPEIDVTGDSEAAFGQFPISLAKEILLEKLAVLDIAEIHIFRALYYELDGTIFYELAFTPSYETIGVASEFGQIVLEEVQPKGTAWITEDGIATMNLEDYCGKIMERSEIGNILTFSQVTDILGKYLENNTLYGNSKAKLTQAELVYYPTLWESELILTPAWHIYIPLNEMMDAMESGDKAWQETVENGMAWNIYLDAVTGELIKVE